jgi:hypothetical protein
LLRRDRAGFLAGVDPREARFHARQAALFGNLADVPIAVWGYQADPAGAGVPLPAGTAQRYGGPVWATTVTLRYGLAGYDHPAAVQRLYLTFLRRGGRWYLGGDDDLAGAGLVTARGLWDFGPVAVLATPRALVLGHPAGRALMAQVAALAAAATPDVTRVWGPWRQRAVVLVPADAEEVRALVPDSRDLRQIAAVAAADLGAGKPLGERIVVNPAPFAALTPFGRRVVLQHELTHIATRAVTSPATPTWLAEGFADYVGYSGQRVTARGGARELAADLRAGRTPARLPGEGDFGTENPRLAQAYEQAWLACRFIVARAGEAGLVRFYREVSAGEGDDAAALDSGLRSVLGLTTEQFVARWRRYLAAQLT